MSYIKKMFLVLFVALIGMVAVPQEAKAMPSLTYSFSFLGVGPLGFGLYDVYEGPIMLVPPLVVMQMLPAALFPPIIISGWQHVVNPKRSYNEIADGVMFDLKSDDGLSVKSNVNGVCNLYELTSGKQVSDKISILGGAYQSVNFQFENKPYLILFEVDGQIVHHQHFYFSNNNLFIGGR